MALWGQDEKARHSAGRAWLDPAQDHLGDTVLPYPRNRFIAGQSTKVQLITSLTLGTWANSDSAVSLDFEHYSWAIDVVTSRWRSPTFKKAKRRRNIVTSPDYRSCPIKPKL